MKAMAAPAVAVIRQPKRSVNILTMGEQKKIMPIERAPTHAAEEISTKMPSLNVVSGGVTGVSILLWPLTGGIALVCTASQLLPSGQRGNVRSRSPVHNFRACATKL